MGVTFEKAMDDDDEATMLFYDESGKRVAAGSDKAVVQHLSNDPARPDAKAQSTTRKGPDETKAKTAPDESK